MVPGFCSKEGFIGGKIALPCLGGHGFAEMCFIRASLDFFYCIETAISGVGKF